MEPDATAAAEDAARELTETVDEQMAALAEALGDVAPAADADEPSGFEDAPQNAEQLAGRIWAILPEVHVQLAAALSAEVTRPSAAVQTIQPAAQQGSVAVISLRGVITPRGSFLARLFGFASGLERFRCDVRDAVNDDSVKAIVIDVDSPGGTIDGVTETAAELFAARGKKPIVAIANTMCASAAYWIASQADELIASPSAQVGSIGVFTVHEDISAMAARMGVKVTIIAAGRFKTEGNSYEPLSKQAAQATQSKCDDLYAMFTSDVARGRGLPIQAVQAGYGEGRCVLAQTALALKMVDRVETFEQTVARLGGSTEELDDSSDDDSSDEDDDTTPDDDDLEATAAVSDSPRASDPAVDYLSGDPRERPSWQIGASRPTVGGRL